MLGWALVILQPSLVLAQAECDQSQELDPYRFLRRLSLDLRQQVPTIEEYNALDGLEDVPESTIDSFLASQEYLSSMRHHHEALLWPNPSEGELMSNEFRLIVAKGPGPDSEKIHRILSAGRTAGYRGSSDLSCADIPQEELGFDGDGRPNFEILDPGGPSPNDDIRQEGFVMVAPYWAPDTSIKVCAFDAQALEVGVQGVPCDSFDLGSGLESNPSKDAGCGCGPNLQWCYGPVVQGELWEEMREQFGEMVDWVTSGQKPYTDLIEGTSVPMNGRMDFWKRHMGNMLAPTRTINHHTAGEPAQVENPDYMDREWTERTASELRVGVQTLPAFMLRFQTNRSRANRFRIVFGGQYFIPPEQPEDPSTADCLETTPDVTEQCTCRYCHQVLEPLAMYWGGFFEAGSVQNGDLEVYRSNCDPKEYEPGGEFENIPVDKMPILCNGFYDTSPEAQNPGWLHTYQHIYLDDDKHNNEGLDDPLHQSMGTNLFVGPIGYATEVINSGQFAASTVKHLFRRLMKRDMNLDPLDPRNELDLLKSWTTSFREEWNYDFPSLVKTMVTHPTYRRVR